MAHKRAPKGYRIVLWSDGFRHVYGPEGDCLEEVLGKQRAIDFAWNHAAQHNMQPTSGTHAPAPDEDTQRATRG